MDIVAENVGKLKEMFPEAFTEDGSYGTTKDTKNTNEKILFKDECYEIQGAIFEVYREMGCGFLESVYQEGLEKELSKRGIPFVAQQELQLIYKGEPLQQTYRPDLICYGQIIVELKAVKDIAPEHKRYNQKLWMG